MSRRRKTEPPAIDLTAIYNPDAPVCQLCGGQHLSTTSCIRCGGYKPRSECFICKNCDDEVINQQMENVQDEYQKKFINACYRARLPERYINTTPDWSMPQKVHRDLYDWFNEWSTGVMGNQWLYVEGHSRTGKTMLAACALKKRMYREGKTGLFLNAARFVNGIRDSLDTKQAVMDHTAEAHYLVIDGFGQENVSPWVYSIWSELLLRRGRDDLDKPTIITTRLTPAALRKRWHEHDEEDAVYHQIREGSSHLKAPTTPYPASLNESVSQDLPQGGWDLDWGETRDAATYKKRHELEGALGDEGEKGERAERGGKDLSNEADGVESDLDDPQTSLDSLYKTLD